MRHVSFPSPCARRVAAGPLLFAVLACCVLGRPVRARADDLDLARERWQTCQELYKKGDPCAALRACEEGLAARATRSLEELTTAARAACDHTSRPPTTKPSRDPDRDGISGDQDLCSTTAEDFDGFQDADGCPDPDNDNDTLTDLLDQCPLSAEDADGFQDADGCPDPDNDDDTILDALDQCPNNPEDFDEDQDTDGCPDDNISAVAITGWSLLGAGVASAGLGIGLHMSAESKRDQVREPTVESDNNFRDVVTSITMREAQTLADDADTLDTAALITTTAGGALVLGGVTLLLLDLFDAADGPPPISLVPSVQAEGASLFLHGRF